MHYATVLEQQVVTTSEKEANKQIFGTLLNHYAEQNKLLPSEEELSQFKAFGKLSKEIHRKKDELKLAELMKIEATRSLSSEELKQKKILVEMQQQWQKEVEAKDDIHMDKFMNDMANGFVKNWKINKSLYETYGGGIVFQQAGLESADARLAFFEIEKKKGNLEFHSEEFESQFWAMLTPNHNHFSYQEKPEGNPFDVPFWIDAIEKMEEELETLVSKQEQ
ncbi:hypothetical protein [Planctobacterium marinum]|uniref:hypothetical protein n=1 Tax=Planctobacterium marinum TaxID=1631968 RepID=UPI0030C6ED16